MKISWDQCSPKALRSHWNNVASLAGEGFTGAPSTQYYRRREAVLFEHYFGPFEKKRVLKLDLWNEVFNTGILEWVFQAGARVFGVDISDVVTSEAARRFQEKGFPARFVVNDIRKLCFKSESFNCVYTMGTIEHFSDYERAIQEIYRVLVPGGIALVGVPNKLDPFLRPVLVALLDLFGLYPYSPEKSFTSSQLRRLLESNGFRIIDRTGLLFMPGWLRMVDLALFKWNPTFCVLTQPFLALFEGLEERFKALQRRGYLIAYCVQKA